MITVPNPSHNCQSWTSEPLSLSGSGMVFEQVVVVANSYPSGQMHFLVSFEYTKPVRHLSQMRVAAENEQLEQKSMASEH